MSFSVARISTSIVIHHFRPSVLQIENYALILGGVDTSTGAQLSVVQSYDMATP